VKVRFRLDESSAVRPAEAPPAPKPAAGALAPPADPPRPIPVKIAN
jgi:hypothetical protein